jgi:hypothetical protein
MISNSPSGANTSSHRRKRSIFSGDDADRAPNPILRTVNETPMDTIRDVAIVISAIGTAVSILTAVSTAIYAFAVLRTEVNQMRTDITLLFNHAADDGKHFNSPAFNEFRENLNLRFTGFEREVSEVKRSVEEVKAYCEEIDGKLDKELERQLSKK